MRIRITKDIWDDGAGHHPATLIARKGEVLNVLASEGDRYEVARNGSFYVYRSECEQHVSPANATAPGPRTNHHRRRRLV